MVKVAGRKETVGRPLLYTTSADFLRHFNLWKVSDLPSLEDLAREAERKRGEETAAPAETVTAAVESAATNGGQAAESAPAESGQENAPSDPDPEPGV